MKASGTKATRMARARRGAGALLLLLASACGDETQAPRSLAQVVEGGTWTQTVRGRDSFGGLEVRLHEGRAYVLESARGADWSWQRRLVAYGADGAELWRFDGAAGEFLTDFALHPSGELTLGLEQMEAERAGYALVRLGSDGAVRARLPLPAGATLPAADLGANLAPGPFRMKSAWEEALGAGWLRLEPRGEDLVAAFLTRVEEAPAERETQDLVSGVMALGWTGQGYAEAWTRLVDGRHRAYPVAWAYDEFGWREASVRLLLAVAEDGGVLVGRTWTDARCKAELQTFERGVPTLCLPPLASSPVEVEHQPFAVTGFSPDGARGPTRVHAPLHLAELVVFDMAVRGDQVVLAGSAVVDVDGLGGKAYYPAEPGGTPVMAPYDGYLAAFDRRTWALRFERLVDAGRAEHLSSVRWTEDGIFAVGGADWDRWYGGMSISRGANPLFVQVSDDGAHVQLRQRATGDKARHSHLLGVDADADGLVAVGLAQAPMTHSGDGGDSAAMTFGGLLVRLAP